MSEENCFQKWLILEGYRKYKGFGPWYKGGVLVSGAELAKKLNEFKKIKNDV